MRIRPILLALGLIVTAVTSAFAGERIVTLEVDNMTCVTCPYTVREALEAVDGVIKADVSYPQKTATVTFDDEKATVEALTAATTNAGYPARPQS